VAAYVFEKGLFMTSMQARQWLKWLTAISRVWCVAFPTTFVLSIAGVIPMICVVVFVVGTIAGLLILTMVVAGISRHIPNGRVRPAGAPDFYHGDNEMWRSWPLVSHDLDLPYSRSASFDEPHRSASDSHMSIKVFDLNADGSPNFTGTGVFSSGIRDIEL
jgi:hypothetical protein